MPCITGAGPRGDASKTIKLRKRAAVLPNIPAATRGREREHEERIPSFLRGAPGISMPSEQAALREGKRARSRDEEVIEDLDVHHRQCVLERAGEELVGLTRLCDARGGGCAQR